MAPISAPRASAISIGYPSEKCPDNPGRTHGGRPTSLARKCPVRSDSCRSRFVVPLGLDCFHEQMRARRSRRARVQPDLGVNLDMRKPLCHLSQMRIEPLISALVFPSRGDLPGRIAEDVAEPMLYPDGVAEFFFGHIDASLRDICP